jgi:hypothetical protein
MVLRSFGIFAAKFKFPLCSKPRVTYRKFMTDAPRLGQLHLKNPGPLGRCQGTVGSSETWRFLSRSDSERIVVGVMSVKMKKMENIEEERLRRIR